MTKKIIITAVITAVVFGAVGFMAINSLTATPAGAATIKGSTDCSECIEYSYFIGYDGRLTVRCTQYSCPTAN